jgi:hypothetical protein
MLIPSILAAWVRFPWVFSKAREINLSSISLRHREENSVPPPSGSSAESGAAEKSATSRMGWEETRTARSRAFFNSPHVPPPFLDLSQAMAPGKDGTACCFPRIIFEKMIRQELDVPGRSRRGQGDLDDLEPVIEILAELALSPTPPDPVGRAMTRISMGMGRSP